jgi:hypothetical protein
MSYGDKVVLFIPSNLAWRTRSWWRYTTKRNPDFEMEMLENQQVQNNKKSLLKLPLIKKPDIFLIYRVSFNKLRILTFHTINCIVLFLLPQH